MTRESGRRAWPILLALAAAIVVLIAVLTRITIRTDITEFLPRGETEAARLVLDEARAGTATGLILIGIEGADTAELARISREMAAALPQTGLFLLVAGGEAAMPQSSLEGLFARRYLLAPADFSVPALRAGLERVLRQLRSSSAPFAAQFGLADPPGALLTLLRNWAGQSQVRAIDGAWFAADRDRALLLARTKAGGMDVPAQEAATAAIEAAFRAANPGSARLLVAGPGVFARDAANTIKWDARRIAILSTVLIVVLLWWRFRSPLVIAAIAAPVVASVAAAAAAVQLGFGAVQGPALGFGGTMLGISVDYPVLMIGHRKRGEPAGDTRRRIGRAFVLAVITAALGLAAMTFSGFPGLVQLGVFSSVGLGVCALLTWFGLPRLIVAANLAPVSAGDPAWLARVEALRRWRWFALVPILAAAIYLARLGGPHWEADLGNLSPVPEASRALDQELRAELGAADAAQLVLVRGPDPESVLQRQERLLPVLDRLQAEGALAGYEAAARLIPSVATQEARRAALPDRATLEARLDEAAAGLPFRREAFQPFLDAVAASRTLPPLRPADLAGTPIAARLDPLLMQRGGEWRGPIVLQGMKDEAAVQTALKPSPPGVGAQSAPTVGEGPSASPHPDPLPEGEGDNGDVLYIDMRSELAAVLSSYTARAWRWLGWSLVLVVAVLTAGLRSPLMVARVLGAVFAAILVTVAVLTLAGLRLSLIHLVALQLVAGVGLDYALFFARRQLDGEERARTLRTLVTCNAMTLLTFGLLALCQTPLLRDIGVTVACGAVLAMGFAFLGTGEAPSRA
ncbi:MAG TPA: MMPL family transporter [Crenalkalicoccus sp.]|nr:MMPL family transporter [Crenalkalicoccus sp.]